MNKFIVAILASAFTVFLAATASASASPLKVEARIDVASQTMTVFVDGKRAYKWVVSTARPGKVTPAGDYTAQWFSKNHRSSLYNNAPMPYSIFYSGNYAIHGTDQIDRLGRPASAGCVRLHPDNARVLFNLARQAGLENTHVRVR